jgi:hypothetical protein
LANREIERDLRPGKLGRVMLAQRPLGDPDREGVWSCVAPKARRQLNEAAQRRRRP